MTTKIGYVEGACSRCGKTYRQKRPAESVECDCYRYCPLCGNEMAPFIPDLSPRTYKTETGLKGQAVQSPEWSAETVYVCSNHSPPYYSCQKPVEVKLS